MGITSLILGIIAFILAFIPGCGIVLSIFPMILGCIFGIIGIITEKGKRAMSITGLCLSIASIFVFVTVTITMLVFAELEDDYETETTPTRTNVTYNMKETARVGDNTVRVTKAIRTDGTEEIKPKEGKDFVVVTVTIQNRGRENMYYAPQNFKIKNSQKQLQRPVVNKLEEATELGYGELMAGGSVTGTVVFEVNKTDKTLSLLYSDDYTDFEDTAEIRLKFE